MKIVRNYVNDAGKIVSSEDWCFKPENSKYNKYFVHPNQPDRSDYDEMFRGTINF